MTRSLKLAAALVGAGIMYSIGNAAVAVDPIASDVYTWRWKVDTILNQQKTSDAPLFTGPATLAQPDLPAPSRCTIPRGERGKSELAESGRWTPSSALGDRPMRALKSGSHRPRLTWILRKASTAFDPDRNTGPAVFRTQVYLTSA